MGGRIEEIYKNTLLSASKMAKIELGCCIIWGTSNEKSDNTVSSGTGFLAKYKGLKFVMTNHHVLVHTAKQFIAQFPDENGDEKNPVFTLINKDFVGTKDLD